MNMNNPLQKRLQEIEATFSIVKAKNNKLEFIRDMDFVLVLAKQALEMKRVLDEVNLWKHPETCAEESSDDECDCFHREVVKALASFDEAISQLLK